MHIPDFAPGKCTSIFFICGGGGGNISQRVRAMAEGVPYFFRYNPTTRRYVSRLCADVWTIVASHCDGVSAARLYQTCHCMVGVERTNRLAYFAETYTWYKKFAATANHIVSPSASLVLVHRGLEMHVFEHPTRTGYCNPNEIILVMDSYRIPALWIAHLVCVNPLVHVDISYGAITQASSIDIQKIFMQHSPAFLFGIPDQTREVCTIAVRNCEQAFSGINKMYLRNDPGIRMAAINNCPMSIYLMEDVTDEERCAAIQATELELERIADERNSQSVMITDCRWVNWTMDMRTMTGTLGLGRCLLETLFARDPWPIEHHNRIVRCALYRYDFMATPQNEDSRTKNAQRFCAEMCVQFFGEEVVAEWCVKRIKLEQTTLPPEKYKI